ncbi:hypothetical protein [Streptomyces sp. HUAS TT7]|uniref:hypothetical protein n=1 Tax=Streptomyces sp. HUAS TT7 TaxID=3447507 RepID=UPI003F656A0E
MTTPGARPRRRLIQTGIDDGPAEEVPAGGARGDDSSGSTARISAFKERNVPHDYARPC